MNVSVSNREEFGSCADVIVFLADGLEECEGLLTVDLLKRAGIKTVTASIMGRKTVYSSHGIAIRADILAENADFDSAKMVVLPGGKAGTENLGKCRLVLDACKKFAGVESAASTAVEAAGGAAAIKETAASGGGKYVAAVCAAPSILASLGLLNGKKATCYPSFEPKMAGAVLTHEGVAHDGNIITGRALGSTIPFALEIIRTLAGDAMAEKVKKEICL